MRGTRAKVHRSIPFHMIAVTLGLLSMFKLTATDASRATTYNANGVIPKERSSRGDVKCLLSRTMFSTLSETTAVTDFISQTGKYQTAYESARATYLKAAKELKEQTGPYKASRDAYVAATATYTKSLYE